MCSSGCAGGHKNLLFQQDQTPDAVITASFGSCALRMGGPSEPDHFPGGNIHGVIARRQGFEGLIRDGAIEMVAAEKAAKDVGIEPKK